MKTTWVLVADAARARLFSVTRRNEWTLAQSLEHAESRLAGHELMSDGPGAMKQPAGSGRTVMSPPTPPREVEAQRFARELVDLLVDGHGKSAYHSLVLCAPPHMLGLLRKGLPVAVERLVSAGIDKNYTHLPDRELPEWLSEALAA